MKKLRGHHTCMPVGACPCSLLMQSYLEKEQYAVAVLGEYTQETMFDFHVLTFYDKSANRCLMLTT